MPLMLNNVQIAGNLTRDPQLKMVGEKTVAEFGLAINRRYRAAGGDMKDETTFVDVTVWGRQAELVGQYLTKGRNCLCEGSLKLDQWEDKQSGAKRSKISVVAQRCHFIGGTGENQQGNQGNGGGQSPDQPQGEQSGAVDGSDEPPY